METTTTQTVVYAPNMLIAQGFRLNEAQRASLQAKADRFRAITCTTELTAMSLPVVDAFGSTIGHMTWQM